MKLEKYKDIMKSKCENLMQLLACVMIFACIALVSSCGESKSEAESTVDSFAVAYYNWRFFEAVDYVAPESKQYLSYIASQVNQEDVDSLRAMDEGAEIEVNDIDIDDDSVADAEVSVSHYLAMDTIGRTPHLVANSEFNIRLVKRGEKWMVKKW